jgi:hypothetical protein
MDDLLKKLPETINRIFDILDLVIVRLALLLLAVFGAYRLLQSGR